MTSDTEVKKKELGKRKKGPVTSIRDREAADISGALQPLQTWGTFHDRLLNYY